MAKGIEISCQPVSDRDEIKNLLNQCIYYKNLVECKSSLAYGYPHGFGSNLTVLIGTRMNRIAEKAATNWVNLPGHFQTMVNPACDTLGVGVTIDNGRMFCYMMVGNPNSYNPYA